MRKLFLTTAILLGMTIPSMALEYRKMNQCHDSAFVIKTFDDADMNDIHLKAIVDPDDVKTFLGRLMISINSGEHKVHFVVDEITNKVTFVVYTDDQTCGVWLSTPEEFIDLIKDLKTEVVE